MKHWQSRHDNCSVTLEVRFRENNVWSPTPDVLADEMAAFANSSSGGLLLGVSDDGKVVGISKGDLDAVEKVVRKATLQSVCPPLAPIIEKLTLPDDDGLALPFIRIEVEPSIFVHESPGGDFHRIGSAKTRMQPDQLARLFQQRSQSRLIRFDETPVLDAPMTVLEEKLWR